MATKLPGPVARALERIRRKHKHASVSVIRNGFYVVESIMRFSEAAGRYKTRSLYLGRIERDGTFVEARRRKVGKGVSSVYDLSEDMGRQEFDGHDLALLKILGTDSRKPVSEISKALRMSASSVSYRIAKLERRYGLRYTIELNTLYFGLSRYAVTVKFSGRAPSAETLRGILEPDPFVLLAFSTKGDYDLLIIFMAENTRKLEDWLYTLRARKELAGCTSVWNISHIAQEDGYIPTRDPFVSMMGEHVWHRSRGSPRRPEGWLIEREYLVLKEMIANCNSDFSEMDRKYNFGRGASLYTYHSLKERGIIMRPTTVMLNPPIKYTAVFHLDQENLKRYMDNRDAMVENFLSDSGRALNRYVLRCGFGSPYGIIMFAPIYEDADVDRIERGLGVGGSVRSLIITSSIVGTLGFRKFDEKETLMYKRLGDRAESVVPGI